MALGEIVFGYGIVPLLRSIGFNKLRSGGAIEELVDTNSTVEPEVGIMGSVFLDHRDDMFPGDPLTAGSMKSWGLWFRIGVMVCLGKVTVNCTLL